MRSSSRSRSRLVFSRRGCPCMFCVLGLVEDAAFTAVCVCAQRAITYTAAALLITSSTGDAGKDSGLYQSICVNSFQKNSRSTCGPRHSCPRLAGAPVLHRSPRRQIFTEGPETLILASGRRARQVRLRTRDAEMYDVHGFTHDSSRDWFPLTYTSFVRADRRDIKRMTCAGADPGMFKRSCP